MRSQEHLPPSLGRPSQGCLLLRLAGAWTGGAPALRPAPRRYFAGGCCAVGGVEAAAARQGRMCLIASVCFWDTGAFKNRALSASLMSARHSHRWHSWTTMVDIAQPRDRGVTFVARSARSVAVRSSLRTSGS